MNWFHSTGETAAPKIQVREVQGKIHIGAEWSQSWQHLFEYLDIHVQAFPLKNSTKYMFALCCKTGSSTQGFVSSVLS